MNSNEKKYDEVESSYIDSIINQFNLLLVTATKIEKETLHLHLKPIEGRSKLIKIHQGKQTYFLGVFGRYNIVHVTCDNMGSTSPQASIATTIDAINYCKPTVVLMMGIAFGKGRPQRIGDVLVSETVTPYEIQRVGRKNTINRGTPGAACTILLNRFKHTTDWGHKIRQRTPAIIPGEILSGEKLVDNKTYKKELFVNFPNAKGGEMEGTGIYTACDGRVKHWLIVKAICDWGDGNKKKRKKHNQTIAANSAIDLCSHIFSSPYAFKDVSLQPVSISETQGEPVNVATLVPSPTEVETEILKEMKEDAKPQQQSLPTSAQTIVRSFLSLSDQKKIEIAKKVGVYDDSFTTMYPHDRDKEIFSRARKKNVLSEMWEELNAVAPFADSVNPYTKP